MTPTDPVTDAETRLWDFVNQTFSGTTTGPRTDAIEQSLRDHERAGLVVSRKDLRALLASLATLREELDNANAHIALLEGEGHTGCREATKQVEMERDHARRICDAVAEEMGFAKVYDPSMLAGKADHLVAQVATLTAEVERWQGLYHELLFQVGKVTPGETRHESAKRIIRQHEDHCGQGGPLAALAPSRRAPSGDGGGEP